MAVNNAPIGDASAVIFSNPIFTCVFTGLILQKCPSLWKISFSILVCIGVIFIVQPTILFGNSASSSQETYQVHQFYGLVWALITAILGIIK